MPMLKIFSRPSVCAACGGPLGEEAIDAHDRKFHSTLCLRKFERDSARRGREKRGKDGGGSGGCHCC